MSSLLFVSKPSAENFILNYTRLISKFEPASSLLVTDDEIRAANAAKDYETIIFEWANDFTAQCLAFDYQGKKLIVRVHDHEVRKGRIHNIPWHKVDAAWFINQEVEKQFLFQYPHVKTFYLPNAIDPRHFTFNPHKEKKIGLLSLFARTRKRIDRAIEVMRYLQEIDPGWELHIKCHPDNPEYREGKNREGNYTYNELKKMSAGLPVIWHASNWKGSGPGWYGEARAEVNEFFQDKAVVLSTSEHEGFHFTVGEAALTGALPVVYNWEFGNPLQFWAPYVCQSTRSMAEFISHSQSPASHRRYVLERFSPEILIPQLLQKIKQATYETA